MSPQNTVINAKNNWEHQGLCNLGPTTKTLFKSKYTKYCNEISSHEIFDHTLYFDEFS